jgi:D-alanyl-D-alanine dipeptidase
MRILLQTLVYGCCIFIVYSFCGCKKSPSTIRPEKPVSYKEIPTEVSDSSKINNRVSNKKVSNASNPSEWVLMDTLKNVITDIRYATSNNFTKKVIYPCGACYLRPEAAQSLMKVSDYLEKKGYKLKLFDCYRPSHAQQKLWDIVPDARYVTPPHKGSMHSRGLAIDLTLTDMNGKDLDMGTAYDYFGEEAHITYTKHSKIVLENRTLLKSAMEAEGFKSIRTEWWHFSKEIGKYGFSNWQWTCEQP